MELRIGLYAFFGYTLAGVAYLAIGFVVLETTQPGTHAGARLDWPLPALLLAVALCYIGGLLLDPIARRVFRLFYRQPTREVAIRALGAHNPAALDFLKVHWPLLVSELHWEREGFVEHADVYKAASVLLRNVGTGFLVGALAVLASLLAAAPSLLAATTGAVLAAGAALAFSESRKFDGWFYSSICERLLVLRQGRPTLQMGSAQHGTGPAAATPVDETTANQRVPPTSEAQAPAARGSAAVVGRTRRPK